MNPQWSPRGNLPQPKIGRCQHLIHALLLAILLFASFFSVVSSLEVAGCEDPPHSWYALLGGISLLTAWAGSLLRWLFLPDFFTGQTRRQLTMAESLIVYLAVGVSMGLFFAVHWHGHAQLGLVLVLLPIATAAYLDRTRPPNDRNP